MDTQESPKRRQQRRSPLPLDAKAKFLDSLCDYTTIKEAAEAAGISASCAYKWTSEFNFDEHLEKCRGVINAFVLQRVTEHAQSQDAYISLKALRELRDLVKGSQAHQNGQNPSITHNTQVNIAVSLQKLTNNPLGKKVLELLPPEAIAEAQEKMNNDSELVQEEKSLEVSEET